MRLAPSARGATLIELMLGLTLAALLLATALRLMAIQIDTFLRTMRGVQLDQDLRAASDLIVRELRRAGHWPAALDGGSTPNPLSGLLLGGTPGSAVVGYSYEEAGVAQHRVLRLSSSTLQMQLGPTASFQALSDPAVTRVLSFELLLIAQSQPAWLACAGSASPGLRTPRQLALQITAESPVDPRVRGQVRTRIRLRNDALATPPTCSS